MVVMVVVVYPAPYVDTRLSDPSALEAVGKDGLLFYLRYCMEDALLVKSESALAQAGAFT